MVLQPPRSAADKVTNPQVSLYFREWGWVRAACKRAGHPEPDRHELHRRALGLDKSHKDFSNEDLDKVLAAFRAVSRPDDLAAQLRQLDMPRRRLLYAIRRLAPDPYWRAIAKDKFGTSDESLLTEPQLQQLKLTLITRHRSKTHLNPGNGAALTTFASDDGF